MDKLLKSFSPSPSEIFRVFSAIDRTEGDTSRILTQACDVLSELTGMAAAATTPFSARTTVQNVQVMPIGEKNVLVAVTTSTGMLKSRIAKLERPADYALLELFYNAAAANFTGLPCTEINRARLQSITASLGARALDVAPLLVSLSEAVGESECPDVILRGASRLMNTDLGPEAPKLIELASNREAFSELLGSPAPDEIRLKIGNENRYAFLRGGAMISVGYRAGNQSAGTIGVLGSVKNDYSHTIPLVKHVATFIGDLLSDGGIDAADKTT